MKAIRLSAGFDVAVIVFVPWLVLSCIGISCLYVADMLERFKDWVQDIVLP